ncbi:MAG: hypothetical protein AB8F74_20655 [Saprospiraceae bacterium]
MNNKSFIAMALASLYMICIFSNCKDKDDENPCDEPITYPTEFLSEESKSYFQNYQEGSKIVFITADETEVDFAFSEIEETMGSYFGGTTCTEDTTRFRSVSGEIQTMRLTLSNSDLTLPITLTLSKFPDVTNPADSEEHLLVRYAQSAGNLLEGENLMIHYFLEENANFTTSHDSLLLNGKQYYDVIKVDLNNPGFEEPFDPSLDIAFSKTLGIIYLNDKINDRELFYERKE